MWPELVGKVIKEFRVEKYGAKITITFTDGSVLYLTPEVLSEGDAPEIDIELRG